MDNLKGYIILFASSFIVITAIMILLAFIRPQVFSLVTKAVPADSLSQHHVDSAKTVRPKSDSLHSPTGHDSLATKAQGDSSLAKVVEPRTEETQKSKEHIEDSTKAVFDRLAAMGVKPISSLPSDSDSLGESEKKTMVQIFELMDAESAAKILMNMDDYAVRQVLASMKSRQSAKILATLEPKQAARILKERKQQ